MIKKVVVSSFVVLLAFVFQAIHPPPPKICSFLTDPLSLTSRIKLKDGRNLVPKKLAKYKVYIHSFGASKFEAALITLVRVFYSYLLLSFRFILYDAV
ncbi:hypothetical protein P3L10_016794 [Capsicum annuum]